MEIRWQHVAISIFSNFGEVVGSKLYFWIFGVEQKPTNSWLETNIAGLCWCFKSGN